MVNQLQTVAHMGWDILLYNDYVILFNTVKCLNSGESMFVVGRLSGLVQVLRHFIV